MMHVVLLSAQSSCDVGERLQSKTFVLGPNKHFYHLFWVTLYYYQNIPQFTLLINNYEVLLKISAIFIVIVYM